MIKLSLFIRSIILALIFLLPPTLLYAATWADSGSYDVSWYSKNKTEFTISSAKQLAGLAYLVNNNYTSFSGITVVLNSNIDLNGRDWISIGIGNTIFEGKFDGKGHSINNVLIYENVGFWTEVKNAEICNVEFNGTVNSHDSYIGFLSSKAENTCFYNLKVNSTIVKTEKKIGGSTSSKFSYYVGGLVAYSRNSSYLNIDNIFNIKYEIGTRTGSSIYGAAHLYAGGIVGYGETNEYEKCISVNDCVIMIHGYEAANYYTSPGSGSVTFGGITGGDFGEKTKILSCYTENNFEGNHTRGTYDEVSFNCAGITGSLNTYASIFNCVACTKKYSVFGHTPSWMADYYHTKSTFSGIGSKSSNCRGCYSNNDVERTVQKVSSDKTGECGSTSFSSIEMHTQNFVDELNFFYLLEYDKSIWKLEDCKLCFLSENNTDDIFTPSINTSSKVIDIYDLQGRKIAHPRKGLNIVKFNNGKSQKIKYNKLY